MKNKIKKITREVSIFITLLPIRAFASSGNKLVSVFDNIITFLSSTLARGVGVTAIIVVGYLYLFQNKIDKGRALSIVASIGIILGAPSLYDMIAG